MTAPPTGVGNSPNATYVIEGLTDKTHAAYCHDALKLLLTEASKITGVTFRTHSESGQHDSTESFWAIVFEGAAPAGRRD